MDPEGEPILSGEQCIKQQAWQQEQGAEALHLDFRYVAERERRVVQSSNIKAHGGCSLSKPKPPVPPKTLLVQIPYTLPQQQYLEKALYN